MKIFIGFLETVLWNKLVFISLVKQKFKKKSNGFLCQKVWIFSSIKWTLLEKKTSNEPRTIKKWSLYLRYTVLVLDI